MSHVATTSITKIGGVYGTIGKRLRDKRRFSQCASPSVVRKSTLTWCNYCKLITIDCDPVIKYAHKVYHFFISEFARTFASRFTTATVENVLAAMRATMHVCKSNEGAIDALIAAQTRIICTEAGCNGDKIMLDIAHVVGTGGIPDTNITVSYNDITATMSVYDTLYRL